MKTILAVFSNDPVDLLTSTLKEYAFNTEAEVVSGDRIKSASYAKDLVVTEVKDEHLKSFNSKTGEMSENVFQTGFWPIKTIELFDDELGMYRRFQDLKRNSQEKQIAVGYVAE
jgi:hypothetical protein